MSKDRLYTVLINVVFFFALLLLLFTLFVLGLFTYGYVKGTEGQYHTPPIYPHYPVLTPLHDISLQKKLARGEYIAKISNCISCHTDVRNNKGVFAGGLTIETPFGGFVTTNITPDKKTGIGLWSLDDFTRAMTKGISPTGKHYFPVFPYLYFANMTKKDLADLFFYLQHIPAVYQQNARQSLPFNLPFARTSIGLWNYFFFTQTTREKKLQTNPGAYLVNGPAHCGMCHTPLTFFAAPNKRYFLAGGFVGGYFAPNITKAALHDSSIQNIAAVFSENTLLHNAGPLAGPMLEVNKNSLHYLKIEDKLAIAHYLKTVASDSPYKVTPSEAKPDLARGKAVYEKVCVICHQKGQMNAPRLGNGPSWLHRIKQNNMKTLYKRTLNGFNSMPKMGGCVGCSKNDVISAVNYLVQQSISYSKWKNLQKQQDNQDN